MAAIGALAGLGWIYRADYFLLRVRHHDHRRSKARLVAMGTAVVPRLTRAVAELGTDDSGGYRADLVEMLQSIREATVAREIQSTDRKKLKWALVAEDEAIAKALATAFRSEADPRHRARMLERLEGLDFRMADRFFADVFPSADRSERQWLERRYFRTHLVDGSVGPGARFYPWRGVAEATVRDRLATIREVLRSRSIGVAMAAAAEYARELHPRQDVLQAWFVNCTDTLGRLVDVEPRIVPWARALRAKVTNAAVRTQLDDALPLTATAREATR